MKKSLLIASLMIVNFAYSQKVAFINEQKILKSIPDYETSLKAVQEKEAQLLNEIKESNEPLQNKFTKILTKYGIKANEALKYDEVMAKLSKSDKVVFEGLKNENTALEEKTKQKNEEYNSFFKEKVGKALEKVNTIVKEYCNKNKIDLLLKVDLLEKGIAFYEAKKDVSEEIIALLKK